MERLYSMGAKGKNMVVLVGVAVFLWALTLGGCDSGQHVRLYNSNDLYALGLSEQDVIYIYPVKGTLSAEPTECAATDLQSFMHLAKALMQVDIAPDIEQNALSSLYRTLTFQGELVNGYIAGEIEGKAYIQRPDGVVCILPETEYEFMLDICGITRPYPEELDQREILEPVKAMASLYREGNIPLEKKFDPNLPQNVNFTIPIVRTVDDFYLTDAYPYMLSDGKPPEGQYVAIVPCGYYYGLQIGMNKIDGQWQVDGVRVARSNLKTMYYPNEDWRLVIFGPSITDISGWGMHKLDRIELYDYKTGEVLWQADGLCISGGSAWSKDGRYFAFSHEIGRAQNSGLQTMLLDTAAMTAITLAAPDGKTDTRLEAREWADDNELLLTCTPKGQESYVMVYDIQSGVMSAVQ